MRCARYTSIYCCIHLFLLSKSYDLFLVVSIMTIRAEIWLIMNNPVNLSLLTSKDNTFMTPKYRGATME